MAYNYQTQYNSPNYTPASEALGDYGMARVIEGITIHHWGDPAKNPQFDSVRDYLCRANGNTSAHFVATGTGRKVACIISPGDIAWHSGNNWGNARTIGIELDPRQRDEDYDVAAELVADIRSAYGDVPIYWHSYFYNTSCPGAWNPERLDALSYTKFSAADWGKGGNITQPTPPSPTPTPTPPKPIKTLYKVMIGAKQLGAFAEESNAWRAFKLENGTRILFDGNDVTEALRKKYEAPSPTTGQPDSGKPVTEKDDYVELEKRVSALEAFIEALKKLFAGLGK